MSADRIGEALAALLGERAKGLSSNTNGRLKAQWADELKAFRGSSLQRDRSGCLWADGVHFGIRAEHAPRCALVVIGVNERGEKTLPVIEDGYRESVQSWREARCTWRRTGSRCRPGLRSATAPWAYRARSTKCFPRPARNAAGSTKWAMSSATSDVRFAGGNEVHDDQPARPTSAAA